MTIINQYFILKIKLTLLTCILMSAGPLLSKTPVFTKKELKSTPPKLIRTCCSFGVGLKMTGIPYVRKTAITSIDNLGAHQYLGGKEEKNGIVYTKRGGFIDIGHLRDYADWTAYLYTYIIDKKNAEKDIILDLGSEGGKKTLILRLSDQMTNEDFYQMAGKIAYDLSIWHEIATWFGTSYIPFVPERYSSFSPEDLYSNLLGVQLGIMALKSDISYDEAMTKLLTEKLHDLMVVPTFADTYVAMNRVKDIWWSSKKRLPSRFVLLDRYFDTPSDTFLMPWIVPDEMDMFLPYKLGKPRLTKRGSYQLHIKANYRFPLKEILLEESRRDVSQDDFGFFISYIKKDVLKPVFGFSSFRDRFRNRNRKGKN